MKVAVIGQSAFGAEVYKHLLQIGHEIVGVFTVPDSNGKEDLLATVAVANGQYVKKLSRWKALKKDGGQVLPEVLEYYKSLGAQLNVFAYVTQFIPMEISEACAFGSIIYHPSLLPRHRGASAINWTLMQGDKKTGLTVFWADNGLDTGPILLQKECEVLPDDTVNSIYKRFLFPEGVKAIGEAVNLIASGNAPKLAQSEEGSSYEPVWKDKSQAKVNFDCSGQSLHNFIRGNDRFPGAWVLTAEIETTVFGSHFLGCVDVSTFQDAVPVRLEGSTKLGYATSDGLILFGNDDQAVVVNTLKVKGKVIGKVDIVSHFKDLI